MNSRTEAKLTDLSGMQKAVEEILKQAWERGRKYGENTVEPKKEIVPVCKVTFDREELQEIVDKKVAEMKERSQGEWIKNETRPNECQCNNCGNYDSSYFPFCHWCGADMRGKK